MESYQQKTNRSMSYPNKGTLNRFLFKTPLIWWRMGLGPIMSHKSLGGSKMLVITSWGRKTNKPRHTMLSYLKVGGKDYVCSGWGSRSDWYKNIKTDPRVTVQVGRRVYSANARRIENIEEYQRIVEELYNTGGDSHFEPWLESFGVELNKEDLITKRDRLIIVGFDENDNNGPPPMPVDLKWVWGMMLFICVGLWWFLS